MLPVAILAGGLATRLRPLTGTIPKSLVPIQGEPFIARQLRLLRGRGIDRVVLCVGHLGHLVREFTGTGEAFGLHVDYSWDGPVSLGTAGALRNALPLLGDSFFVVYGDSYLPCDYGAVQTEFLSSGKDGLMTVFRNEARWDASNVEFEAGKIVDYNKRRLTPRMHYIDYGLGAFRDRVFAQLPPGPHDLADIYGELLARNELAAMEIRERFYEVGSLNGLAEFRQFVASEVTA